MKSDYITNFLDMPALKCMTCQVDLKAVFINNENESQRVRFDHPVNQDCENAGKTSREIELYRFKVRYEM